MITYFKNESTLRADSLCSKHTGGIANCTIAFVPFNTFMQSGRLVLSGPLFFLPFPTQWGWERGPYLSTQSILLSEVWCTPEM